MEEGEQIADSAINVCLRGPRKNLIIRAYFLASMRKLGEEDRLFGRAHGEFHFRVPHEDDDPPTAVDGNRKKRSLCVHVTCVIRCYFARGNKIYLFSAQVRGEWLRIRVPEQSAEIREPRNRGRLSKTHSFTITTRYVLLNIRFIYVMSSLNCVISLYWSKN